MNNEGHCPNCKETGETGTTCRACGRGIIEGERHCRIRLSESELEAILEAMNGYVEDCISSRDYAKERAVLAGLAGKLAAHITMLDY